MASLNCNGLDGFILSMKDIVEIPVKVKKEILNAQADIVVEAQKKSAKTFGVFDTGETENSIIKGKPRKSKDTVTIYVFPDGERTRITPKGKVHIYRNAEIAFINEYGKRGQPARPFIRTANESSAEQTTAAAAEVYDAWLKTKGL